MTWKDDVYIELLRYTETNETEQFTLEEFYQYAENQLAAKHPNNNNVQAKIRQILQRLRDDGQLEFINNDGVYRFVELDEEFQRKYGVDQQTVETTRYPMAKSVRVEALQRYNKACLLTDVDLPALLDAAHVLPRAERPSEVRNPKNILVLNKLHHEAFDRDLFTIDTDYCVQVDPELSTDSELVNNSLVAADGKKVRFPESASLNRNFLAERNAELAWV